MVRLALRIGKSGNVTQVNTFLGFFINRSTTPDTIEVVQVQPARLEAQVDHTHYDYLERSYEPHELVRGLSESDFMLRQRYLENSGHPRSCSQSISIASHPLHPILTSSVDVHNFVQEQRKIIANFRTQPWPMEMKISALKAYRQNLSKYANQMNTVDMFRDTAKMIIRKCCRKWKAYMNSITIWKSIIKQIEGRFGSSVASFFTFIRWLCAINLFMALLVLLFLVIPQVISGHGLQVPKSVRTNGSAFSFIIDGKGYYFEYSVLFYGYYDSGRNEPYSPPPNNPNPEIGWGYKLPLAYLGTIIALFVSCIIAILISMAEKYKVLQRAGVSEHYLFAWKVFTGWDHAITSADTAASKARHLSVALKETILEAEKQASKRIEWRFLFLRITSQLVVLIILLASSYAIYLTVENTEQTTSTSISDAITLGWQGLWLFIQSFQVQAVVITRNMLLPYLFKLAEYLENHHPRTALKIMLVRLFLLYVTSLYVLIVALFTLSKQCTLSNSTNTNSSIAILPWSNVLKANENDSESICCWESIVGQELFKLSITHMLAELFNIFVNDIARWAIMKSKLYPKLAAMMGYAEFRLAENILKLVYGQALVWLGVLFCPLLPVINFIKSVLLFYTRSVVVSIFNKPPHTMFRVASTKNFYMALLLLMAFLCIFPVGYAIMHMTPSSYCGPFRGLPNMIKIFSLEVATWPKFLQSVLQYIQTPTVILSLIALLCMVIYYYSALATALKEVNKDLRLQLHLEQKETQERIIKDAQDGNNVPPVPSLLSRHKVLQKHLREKSGHHICTSPPPPPPPTSSQQRMSLGHQPTSRQIRVREVEDEELTSLRPYSPHSLETDWCPAPHTTVGYVDHKSGRTIRQTAL